VKPQHTSPRLLDASSFWLAVVGRPRPSDGDEPTLVLPTQNGAEALELRLPDGSDARLARRSGIAVLFDGQLHSLAPLVGQSAERPSVGEAELILESYCARGLEVVQLLRGEFALLIWDEASGDVVLSRDPLGHRPLCYGQRDGRLVVSPSPELVASVVGADVNAVAVAEWVLSATIETSQTFYARVNRLSPGHVLERRDGRESVAPYWRPEPRHRNWDPQEAHEEFERLLRQPVRRAVEAGRVGVFLSGGIDSALVAAIAAEESRRIGAEPPLALLMRFPYVYADETVVQRAIATDLELDTVMLTLEEAAGPAGVLVAGMRQSGRDWLPPINPWQSAYDTLTMEGVRRGCTSVLSGEGGNLIMEPTWDEISDLVVGLDVAHLAQLARDWARYDPRAKETAIVRAAVRFAAKRTRRRFIGAVARRAPSRRLRGSLEQVAFRHASRAIPAWAVPDGRLRREIVEKRANELLSSRSTKNDWVTVLDMRATPTMLEGSFLAERRLHARFGNVYYEPGLFSFRSQAPTKVLLLGGRYKGLGQASYRRLASDGSAELLRTASFDRAFEILLDRELPQALRDLGNLQELSRLGVIQPEEFVSLIRGSSRSSAIGYYRVWQVLACEAWFRTRS
jgi:Asparagine synthase/Glutamine amidotransferase domain